MVAVQLTKAVQYGLSVALSAKEQGNIASNRLATGVAVQSALDDPSAYFASQSLSANAATLDRVLSKLTQGVQTVKAAHSGLAAITKQIDVASALTNRAKATDNLFERAGYAAQYNTMLEKITELAKDSGYGDRNLLAGTGNDVKLYFSDDSSYAALIKAVDNTDLATLGLEPIDAGEINSIKIPLAKAGGALGVDDLLVSDSTNFAIGDVIEVETGGNVVASVTVTGSTTLADLISGLTATDKGFRANHTAGGDLVLESLGDFTVSGGKAGGALEAITITGTGSDWADPAPIETTADQLADARKTVQTQTSTFAADLAMLQKRLAFMTDYSAILKLTSEAAVAADPSEEGANVLALQLRQQLATTSLSLSRTIDESILRMLG